MVSCEEGMIPGTFIYKSTQTSHMLIVKCYYDSFLVKMYTTVRYEWQDFVYMQIKL